MEEVLPFVLENSSFEPYSSHNDLQFLMFIKKLVDVFKTTQALIFSAHVFVFKSKKIVSHTVGSVY